MLEAFFARRDLARIGHRVAARLEGQPRIQKIDPPALPGGAQIYVYQGFLGAEECAELCRRIDADAKPSLLYRADERVGVRTSFSCDFDRYDPTILAIDERICGLMGLDPRQGETLQGQRYEPGQYFRGHHDYFMTSEPHWREEKPFGGQRCWTAMIFLNEPQQGGETEFPLLGFQMLPRTGMLMIWNNMRPDGSPNPQTLHSGNEVLAGTKYIVTKWFRRGFWVR